MRHLRHHRLHHWAASRRRNRPVTGRTHRSRRALLVLAAGAVTAGLITSAQPSTNLTPQRQGNSAATTSRFATTSSRGNFALAAAKAKAGVANAPTPKLSVLSALSSTATHGPKAGATVAKYHWLLNLDNTGNPTLGKDDPRCHPLNPNGTVNTSFPDGPNGISVPAAPLHKPDPAACPWPSMHYATQSPVISEGDQTDWNASKALPAFDGAHGLPPGKYLVSVTADGYQIGGVHFTICPWDTPECSSSTGGPQSGPGLVVVGLNPYPIPLGTIQARAFADIRPTTGVYQATDPPLQGFHAVVGDYSGVVSADYFGNPLCTEYVTVDGKPGSAIKLDSHGVPTPKAPAAYTDGVVPGNCQTGADGIVRIPNLPPNRYDVQLIPPQSQQPGQWIQSETLEGNHAYDVWLMAGDLGVDTEQVVGGEPVPFVSFAFVPPANGLPNGFVDGGNVVKYTRTSLTDTTATWTANQWNGDTVTSGANRATVTGNTATRLTLSGWSPQTPSDGQSYSIAHTNGSAPSGEIKGQIMGTDNYVPGLNGIPGVGGNSGFSGIKLDRPPVAGWVALSDMNLGGDGQLVYAAQADVNGNFDIKHVPDGDYNLAVWDQPQDYALDQVVVTVAQGQLVDVGVLPLLNWFTRLSGHVFVDLNGNARQDPGEPGVPDFVIQNLNRTNNTYEQGQQTARTNDSGAYELTEAYPLGQFNVEQYFNTRYKTTGITYQACNDKQEHSLVSPFVDVSYLPIIGQCGRIDIGVQPYDVAHNDNGGIVATVLNDSIRVTYPARQAVQFPHMVGIPGFQMDLYEAVTGAPNVKNPDGSYTDANGFMHNPDGSYRTKTASPLNGNPTAAPEQSYVTEHWAPPTGCNPQDANGKTVGNDQQNAVPVPDSRSQYVARCIESSITGVGIGGGTDNELVFPSTDPNAPRHGIQTVDGNYGLDATDSSLCKTDAAGNPVYTQTSGCFLNKPGDFIIRANMPLDNVLKGSGGAYTRPLYTATSEADVNVATGTQYIPQGSNTTTVVWPPVPEPCTVQANTPHCQVPGVYPENPGTTSPGPDAQCAGPQHTVNVTNPDFLAIGGSPFQGQKRNTCESKLIHVQVGQSVAPNFHVHTTNDVPIPGRYSGYIVDDISAQTDRKSTTLGEVAGIAGAPIGIYDWANNLEYTTLSDYNGQFELLMPSTQDSNCLTPAGVCPNVYRFVGNDPGQFPNPNPTYNPSYRTIAANFQAWPGQWLAADVAPSKAITNLEAPGAQFTYPPLCNAAVDVPQILAIDRPYRTANDPFADGNGNVTLDIKGQGFVSSQGTTTVTLGGQQLSILSITNQEIKVRVPRSFPTGPHQLLVTNGAGLGVRQGLTYHVLGQGYNPTVLAVGPTKGPNDATGFLNMVPGAHRFTTIQAALEYAAGFDYPAFLKQVQTGDITYPKLKQGPIDQALIVVYPADPLTSSPGGAASMFTPFGTYFENLIVHSPAKLQGVGPGGLRSDGSAVQGTRIDGAYFWSTNNLPDVNGNPEGGDNLPEQLGTNEPYAAQWLTLAEGINSVGGEGQGWDGNSNIVEGQVVYVVAKKHQYTNGYKAAMDGFSVTGGDQKDFPGNINEAFGSGSTILQEFGKTDELPGVLQTQGGGIFLNAYADHFQISNNLIQGNSGSYGGAIRVGTPYVNDGTVEDGAGQTNTGVVISRNQIIGNGGTNLAGAVGLFSGSDGYHVERNVLCGNYALEYGGGISHFGLSGDAAKGLVGSIDHNRIYLNGANDEGGGVSIAGELPLPAGLPAGGGKQFGGSLSPGAGPVTIDSNYITSNISDDDGGGVRFLSAGAAPMRVTNNFITNNDASHEGGGIAIDDTPNITISHDTIARNVTTATASTSDGAPQPTGVSTARNSDQLQRTLPAGSPLYSKPTISNSIIWDNRAGAWASGGVVGIGLPNDTTPINVWDIGTVDQSGLLAPTHTVIDTPANAVEGCQGCDPGNPNASGNYVGVDPQFTAAFATQIDLLQLRTYFRFRPSAIVSIALPANAFGDYRSPFNTANNQHPSIGASIPGGLQ